MLFHEIPHLPTKINFLRAQIELQPRLGHIQRTPWRVGHAILIDIRVDQVPHNYQHYYEHERKQNLQHCLPFVPLLKHIVFPEEKPEFLEI